MAIVALAVAVRVWLIFGGLPRFDSDEGTMGLMALHIDQGRDFPAFFYGQAYMGAAEAYIAAVLFPMFGASDAILRLALVGIYVVFLGAMYLLLRLLHGRAIALAGLLVLAAGSQEIFSRELKAVGGYPELLALAAVLLLIATYAASTATGERRGPRRWTLFAGWGLAADLGIWSDGLIVPFVVTSGALLLWACRRELRGIGAVCLLAGLVVGAGPLIAYNATAPAGQDTASSILAVVRAGGSGHVARVSSDPSVRIAGTVAVSLPVITGGNGLCSLPPQDAWPLFGSPSSHVRACTAVHATWGGVIAALWLGAMLAWVAKLRRRRRTRDDRAEGDRRADFRAAGRLAVLAAAGLTVLLFLVTSAPAEAPWYNVRYLTGVWIAVPEILASAAGLVVTRRRFLTPTTRAAAAAIFALFAIGLIRDATNVLGDSSYVTWLNGQQLVLARSLEAGHISRIYSDYWTCDWLAFETNERIVCAALDTHLRPSLDRYAPYRRELQSDPRPTYVFRADAPQVRAIDRMRRGTLSCLSRAAVASYIVFGPVGRERSAHRIRGAATGRTVPSVRGCQ